ncbi:hypothetical protein ACP4OV_005358 [Aristida adscensionis]
MMLIKASRRPMVATAALLVFALLASAPEAARFRQTGLAEQGMGEDGGKRVSLGGPNPIHHLVAPALAPALSGDDRKKTVPSGLDQVQPSSSRRHMLRLAMKTMENECLQDGRIRYITQ